MSQVTDVIALVFDFDDTLVPDSTTKLLRHYGIDTEEFWGTSAKQLIHQGYDPPAAYLKLLLDNVGPGKPLGELTNEGLRQFGTTLDGDFHEGLPDFFEEIRSTTASKFKNIDVEFYIVSGGLQAILDGSEIVRKYFSAVYGCQLAGDTEEGTLKYIKRSITFTEKTRYLFEINKGIPPEASRENPYLVNEAVAEKDRRVPFTNFIYVGDGQTDIPCFSLVQKMNGTAFGVFDPSKEAKAKQALEAFLKPGRVVSMHAPKYTPDSELGAMLRAAVATRCSAIQLQRRTAFA